jgi:hypothetical protein
MKILQVGSPLIAITYFVSYKGWVGKYCKYARQAMAIYKVINWSTHRKSLVC